MPITDARLDFADVRRALPRPYRNCDRRRYVVWALYELEHKAHIGEVPFHAGYVAQGIAWTIETGRLVTPAHQAITGLDRAGLARLVIEAGRACEVAGDVPYWLNAHYGR